MKRALLVLAAYPLIAAGSCATTSEPTIRTVEVQVPVVQPCPDKRNTPPLFPDTLEALRAAAVEGGDVLSNLFAAGREMRIQWQGESDAQIKACAGPR